MPEPLPAQIEAIRKRQNISQAAAAAAAQMPNWRHWSAIVAGKRPVSDDLLDRMAAAVGCRIERTALLVEI